MNAPARILERYETLPARLMVGRFIERVPSLSPGQLLDVIRAAANELTAFDGADEIHSICDAIDRDLIAEDEGLNATPGRPLPVIARGA